MAIIENFYNGDRARDIREVLTKNFANVAKYIPNNFLSLTTLERQNLSDDYKTHFKLVFDKEKEYVYRWSEVERNWSTYLIRAKDEQARAEAAANTENNFANAVVGKDIGGANSPYAITFYNRLGVAKKTIFLTAANIKYNNQYSTEGIITKIINDFNSLDDFIGDRDVFLNNSKISAKTVTGALNEINQKTIDNKTEINNIKSGATVVPKAQHANEADHALLADSAKDADKLGGQLPTYYATQSGLNSTNQSLNNTINRVTTNESDIAELQKNLSTTNTNLNNLKTRVDRHDTQIQTVTLMQQTQASSLDELRMDFDSFVEQVGWEILTN